MWKVDLTDRLDEDAIREGGDRNVQFCSAGERCRSSTVA